jgi:hypothetical protein
MFHIFGLSGMDVHTCIYKWIFEAVHNLVSPYVKIMGYDALNSIQLGYCYTSVIPFN